MENLKFNIAIDASPAKVWDVLFTDENYPKWTDVFCEGSHAVTDWKEGSKVLFLDNKGSGMFAVIEQSIPNEFLSIKGLGEVKDGKEITDTDDAQMCAGGLENYTLDAEGDQTNLMVELKGAGFPPEMIEFFKAVWPKALDKVKKLAEV